MEGWSNLRDGFTTDGDFIGEDFGFSECNFRLRSMFDEVLREFLSERSAETKCVKPIPVMGGDGQPVDLFKLFWVIRKIGGYDVVCKKNLWGSVKVQCGLGFGSVGSIRLIYDKYLNEFDEWLWNFYEESSLENEGGGIGQKLDLFSQELETRFRGSVSIGGEEKKIDSEFGEDNGENEGYMLATVKVEDSQETSQSSIGDDDNGKLFPESGNDLVLSAITVLEKVISKVDDVSENKEDSTEGGFGAANDEIITVSAENVAEKVFNSRKRKRESISSVAVVNWMKHLAVNFGDPSFQKLPEFSKWRKQALFVRKACFLRRNTNSNAEEASQQKKQRMNPSMYEDDDPNDRLTERLRARRKVSSPTKFRLCSCSNSCSTTCQKTGRGSVEEPEEDDSSMDEPPEVSVGPEFQAEVPEWTRILSDSDPKWLGTRMWPLEDGKHETMMKFLPIGRGRQDFCDCPFPASVECVRFHIAEKRLQLKVEIGSLFYKWKFDRMGEEVSLSWTAEDEDKFKDMMRLNVAPRNKFWTNAFKIFRYKTRKMLVSYYFNVFLVQRRSFQNRVMPRDVDSDDDDKTVGSIGELYGYKALKFPGHESLTCVLNKECTFEY